MMRTHRHPSLSSPPSPREVSRPCPSCSSSASSSSSRAGFETTPDHHHEGDDHDDHGTSYITWLTINNTQNMKPIMKQQLHKDSYITCTTLTDNPVSLARASRTCKLYQICLENMKCWKWITWKLSAYFFLNSLVIKKFLSLYASSKFFNQFLPLVILILEIFWSVFKNSKLPSQYGSIFGISEYDFWKIKKKKTKKKVFYT